MNNGVKYTYRSQLMAREQPSIPYEADYVADFMASATARSPGSTYLFTLTWIYVPTENT
jgi:hypothetical protein